MVAKLLSCRNLALCCALTLGGSGSLLVLNAFSPKIQMAIAQPTETAATDNSFLQSLLQVNQNFLTLQPQLRRFPSELEALDKKTKSFDAVLFQDYSDKIQNLQQQVSALETQFGQFSDEQQQLAIKAELEKLQIIVQNLISVSEPFVGGFNADSIRQVQEFLDFFDRLGLTDNSYGFYGTVTQTEMTTYVNQQLTNFSATLKQLNQISTRGAIAPDLATSINYLYTTLSLDSSSSGNVQETIAQLETENAILEKRIDNTHRIILFLPLIVMLPTTVLVFILFYYFGKIFQEKVAQPSNYQFSLNDIYGLEDELFAKLSEKYELKPRLIQRRDDPFAQKLISFANTTIDNSPSTTEQSQSNQALDDRELTSDPELVMDGDFIDEDDDDDSFPVNLPNVYDDLVDQYNKDASHFQGAAIALSISHQESYLDDEAEFMPMLLLNANEAGEYWVTDYKSLEYLLPKADLSITSENYGNFKNIFICYGYQPDTVQKAKLLKPARVSSTEETDTWELVQQGIVVLHRI